IAVAATLKTLNNSHTNAQGQLAGLSRGHIIEKQKAHDDAVVAWAGQKGAFGASMEAKKDLDRLSADRRSWATRDFLFTIVKPGPVALRHATTLVRLAAERAKPDADRDPDYMNRE